MQTINIQQGFLKTTWIVVPLLLCAGALFAWNWAAQRSWPVQWVHVEGTFRQVSAEEIRAQLAPLLKVGFFGINAPSLRATIEDMPWIRRADIRRRWPDAVVVTVEEQEPVARWHDGRLMNSAGELFDTGIAEGFAALPVLAGPAGLEAEVFEAWQSCSDVLLSAGLLIRSITLDERRAWSLELDDGAEIALGRKARDTRIRRLARVYARLMNSEPPPVAVDLRYTNGLAVRREVAPDAPTGTSLEQPGEQPGENAADEELAEDSPPEKDNSA
jgi:cell division protein FtsQ